MAEIIPTEAENGEEYIGTIAEDTIVAGVSSLNGETGDLNIKTVNGNTLLGEGDIEIETDGVSSLDGEVGDLTLKTVNGNSLLGGGDIEIEGGGVTSVNGETGDVVITASGIGAATESAVEDLTTTVSGKQDTLNSNQMAAVNSGVTSSDITKLSGIESGAEVNVQANWNETNSNSDAYIQNKPTIPAAQVQSNWNETNTSAASYIQNKPTIPDAPVQSNWNESDTASLAYIQNKPTIPQGIVELTSADYNYPTSSPDGIAIWLLNAGHYSIKAGSSQVKVYLDTSSPSYTSANSESELIISGPDALNQKNYYYAGGGYSAGAKVSNIGFTQTSLPAKNFELLNVSTTVNNLTSTDTRRPLSANQGKVLKGLVDGKASNTAFTGTDGTTDGATGLVPAPLIADADKYLKSDGTWAAISAGGGDVKTLTSADANYPVDNPTMIAAWLLDPGYYKIDNIRVYATSSSYSNNGLVIVGKKPSNNIVPVVMLGEGRALYSCCVNATSGSVDEMTANASPLLINSIDDWLTSTSTKHVLSAKQGKVLNDKIGGDLSSLTTTDKTSLIAAINELASRVSALE